MARQLAWALACVLAASALCIPASAAAPSPPAGKKAPDCSTVIYGMMDCLDYVSAGSNTSKPDESCCEGVKNVVQASPLCLCEALQEAHDMKIDLNMTRATELPALCKLPKIDEGHCSIADAPGAAPAPSTPKTPAPSSSPGLPVPPPSSPVVPGPPAEKPTTPKASAPAPLSHSGAPSLPFNVIVLVICLAATAFLYF